jgi:predicted HicB family RNase H-like nuclease
MDTKISKLLFYRDGRPKYRINSETGCWDWIASLNRYGYVACGGGSFHRKLFIERYGRLSKHKQVDHVCRNRKCVNIQHFEAVSPRENVQRGRATKLKDKDIAVIRKSKKSAEELAREFGVTANTVKGKRVRTIARTNTPRERGAYKSYSLRLPKRDLEKLQKAARKEKISFNTWVLTALREKLTPAAKPEEIELVEVVEVPSGDSVQA